MAGQVSQKSIARSLGLSQPTVSKQVNLIKEGIRIFESHNRVKVGSGGADAALDHAFVGGKRKNGRGSRKGTTTPVLMMCDTNSMVSMEVVTSLRGADTIATAQAQVCSHTQRIVTDEHLCFNNLNEAFPNAEHVTCKHNGSVSVDENGKEIVHYFTNADDKTVHNNYAEGAIGDFKRQLSVHGYWNRNNKLRERNTAVYLFIRNRTNSSQSQKFIHFLYAIQYAFEPGTTEALSLLRP